MTVKKIICKCHHSWWAI